MILILTLAGSLLAGCGKKDTQDQAQAKTTTDNKADTSTTTGTTDTAKTDTNAGSTKDEKITLSIYTQYADDDTKVPYDYAVEQLAIAYPNVELNLIVHRH